MELYQVRAFVTVARLGNVTKAADSLCVTQPAVTAQIKSLESALGVALFDRGGGRLSLTRAGEKLLPQAEALLAAAGELQGAARQMQGEITGRIDLGLPGETTDFLRLGPLAAGVQHDLPLVELHTHTSAVGALLDRVRGGTLAAAFSIGVHPPRDLQWQALRSVSYRVVIPTALATQMQRGGWRVLAALPWVDGAVDSHIHQMLRGLFEQQGLSPNVALRSEDTSALEAFVRAGSACALLREEVALPGVERREWVVWGHARVDAQLFFSSTAERAGDPLIVALEAVVRSVWT
ncbi:MAG: LysR family transcriptional regulator [Rubrivivax sp.]|nr:LysR family transcriptional regulator [Rubrivivax sp.]